MVQVEKLIQYCKLLKYLRIAQNGKHHIAYRYRILSTTNIEIMSGPYNTEWYKTYTDTKGNNYFISVGLVNSVKL